MTSWGSVRPRLAFIDSFENDHYVRSRSLKRQKPRFFQSGAPYATTRTPKAAGSSLLNALLTLFRLSEDDTVLYHSAPGCFYPDVQQAVPFGHRFERERTSTSGKILRNQHLAAVVDVIRHSSFGIHGHGSDDDVSRLFGKHHFIELILGIKRDHVLSAHRDLEELKARITGGRAAQTAIRLH